ncbi:uncharacterized protein [Musca autumnalis]|uniref:uncharacterized protein n=1 Tax=Musca autumnalis TaxID=221902 RepID=UPI003CF65B0F
MKTKFIIIVASLLCASVVVRAGIIHTRWDERESEVNTTSIPLTTEGPGGNFTTKTSATPTNTTWSPSTTEGPGLNITTTTVNPPTGITTTAPPVTEGPGETETGGVIVHGDCSFRVTGDLNDPAPLFSKAGALEWLVPNPSGVVEIKNGHYIDMYCSESFQAPYENMTKITAQCLQGLYFLVDGIIRPFNNFSCTDWPVYTARRTGRNCSGGTDLLEVGFEVSDGFIQTMDICHDEVNEVTRYVHHVLNPASAAYQRSVARPRFIEGDFYKGKNVDNLYTKVQQNITISNILGMDASPYFNDSIDIYMARGHMAAKVDFIFGAHQMATFFFVNVGPQWQAFNGGNWERVEDGVRKYVANQNLTVDCYTGIWGVSTLPDVNGTQKELYLAFDENNNGLIPVPKIYFRVVIDRDTRKGIVLIGVNNPHASLQQIMEEYVICEDIGHKIDWIQWAKEDLYKGYSYACSVPDFIKVVKHLPLDDLETSGILGIEEDQGCSFRVSGDLKDPAPLFSHAGRMQWVVPNPSGVVELKSGEALDMYCSQTFVGAFQNLTKVTAECQSGFTYLVGGQKFNFSDFSCSEWPVYTARRTGRNCSGGTDLLEIGFEVSDGFIPTMDICHDEVNEVTRYVHHVLNPSSAAYQRSVARPRFIEGDFYKGKNVDNLYTKVQQNITISNILGMDASPYFNDSIDIYMARGHMAAKVDFIFGAHQMSTFMFVNVGPQWQAFNGGNWERVEDGVRKYVANQNLTVDCYTGIWGVSTLPDVNGTQKELYLAFDENNNGLIPVPKIYFRVVIDRDTRKGIVLIGVNNPHASLQQIMEEYVICEDIGHKIDWIQWAKEDLYKGYSYACSVPDFIKVVKHLPLEDLETSGILGIEEDQGCSFRVSGDLKDPAPLFSHAGLMEWVVPNPSGVVELKSGEALDMYCSQTFVGAFENLTKVTAECQSGFTYLVGGQTFNFSDFSCSDWPVYTARRTGRNCSGGTDLLEIGFEVSDGFIPTMDICHDEVNEVTRYVHHVLNPSSAAYQRSVARPRFIEGDFYKGKNVDNLYTKVQQNITISNILGMDASPYFNDSIDIYMARGHMAAKVDFIFGAHQMSTFMFVNVGPQWQAFNGGNWERVEDGVRKYVANQNLTVDCYTGIWGVSTLPDVNGTQKELYLAFDENNNGLIPVPKIYFRVVIDRDTRKGIVLIGVNNPHASLQQIIEEYVICEDIGHKIDWIQWAKEDLYKGYSYACSVPDFIKVVKHLPLDDLETSGILGIEEDQGCSFRVSGDLKDPAPLFSHAGRMQWVVPNPSGVVELKSGEAMDMYCSQSFVGAFANSTKVTAECQNGFTYLVGGQKFNFSDFSCSDWPVYTARRTGRNCSGGTDFLEIGFEVSDGFIPTMDICHDEVNEVTRYVHHVLNPSSAAYQRSVARPRFIEGDFYKGKNVDNLYTKVQQNITISNILGMDASPYFNDSIDIYMARGHMAAKVDFIFGAHQMSTFMFVNVGPQWQAFNGGNWERVEDGVRKYVANQNLTVDCYTGIWGVSTLPDVNGTQKELYLAFDENNNGLIPVPKIYFRVVIDRDTRKGIVLIGVNNPHASLQQIMEEYVICEDIGNKIDWIQWAKEDLYKGYSYACSVPDFIKVVKHLPLEDLETSGILGIKEDADALDDGCSFRVSGDLKDPAPLFTNLGTLEWIEPNPDGLVVLQTGQSVDMYCSKSFVAPFTNQVKLTAQCQSGFTYLVEGQKHNFSDFSCSAWPVYTVRRTGRSCNGGTDLLEVGFEVSDGFLQTMDVCHDEVNEVTRYVHHVLTPSSNGYQRSVNRPSFKPGDFFAGKNVDNLYTQVQQNLTISNILGMDASPYFEGSNIYLARGHMAAKVDFIFGSPQRATFYFVNAAPQWQVFNAGNWERVEDGVRKYVADQKLTVDCYTGVWGVSTLSDVNGNQQELYLAFDENNNGLIPVPKIYYRVVIDRATRKGIVLIGVNNPHASLEQVMEEYVICEDIGDKIDWINWTKDSLTKGYSYACSVPDFIKVVKHLPFEDLETSGILGVDEENTPEGDCTFRVSGDLNDPAPLLTKFGTLEWIEPNPSGVVELKAGESIDMYCSKSFVAPFTNQVKVTANCHGGFTYLVEGQKYNFSDFSCSAWPVHTVRRTGRSCNGGTDLLEVGFDVSDGFLRTMDVCHDEVNEVTRYVHHVLTPSSNGYQKSVNRPSFKPGDFYAGKNVDNLYTQVQQNITISNILGMDASPYFEGSNIYLARGHMAAKVDFIFGSPQRATFYFVNAAPQWQVFNAGNWERVEDGVRKYVADQKLTVDCYTGVWGVSTLADVNGNQQELYLAFDENNNGLIPVPKIYFRVVIDRASRKGIVLIGVNNPHASLELVMEEYVICEDIGDKIDWINWTKDSLTKGYSYACSVPDFIKVVKHLPIEDLETSGILGVEEENTPEGDCTFRVSGDLNDPAPLFTKFGTLEWLEPNPSGVVELKAGESIDMYCSKSFVAPFTNQVKVTANCHGGFTYLVEGQKYNFSDFSCSAWPVHTVRRTGRSCNGGTDLLEVGFEVSDGFLQTMDVCHDEVNEVTRYVHHVLTPSSNGYQKSVNRPSFKPGDFYAGKNVDNLYTQVQQNITISNILGMDASPYFEGSNIYLARGHMAAKVDFIFGSPQRATFYFVNAAPQWQVFNAGNWERVEDGVRKYVADQKLTVDCYTGVWGVSTLADVNGNQQEMYLAFDENNNGLIPVPKIYFRVVIDRATRKGIVLIGVNNPHASLEQVMQEYVICEDIGDKLDWINWTKDSLTKGYSYACSVPDFIKVVKHLPIEDLETSGILGLKE